MMKKTHSETRRNSNFAVSVSVELNGADQVSKITIASAGNNILLCSIKDKEPEDHPWENLPGYDN